MITVSIVTYKTDLEELSTCLNSLRSNAVKEIYIVDNSCKDDIRQFCENRQKVLYLANANTGYGSGHNVALRKSLASGVKYHLVLNSDVYFDPHVLCELAAYMDENNDVAMVQPNIVYPDGCQQYTCRLLPTPLNLIFRRFMPPRVVEKMNWKYQLKFFDHKREANIPYHQGSFLFFRLSAFNKVGLFDERFFMYPEDIDITRRMHKYYRTMFWPGVTVVHAHRAASYKNKKMLWIHMWNMIKYFTKWGWVFDSERRRWNRDILTELGYKNN